ncbi:hypothetical protein ACH5RR_029933 [Cinchona calisaya]|uniref:Uncharacterized protein n=1 Tax=Cinchona calisaya TaxID=153742 RepID=A0ABD2YWF3_9GENT
MQLRRATLWVFFSRGSISTKVKQVIEVKSLGQEVSSLNSNPFEPSSYQSEKLIGQKGEQAVLSNRVVILRLGPPDSIFEIFGLPFDILISPILLFSGLLLSFVSIQLLLFPGIVRGLDILYFSARLRVKLW